MPRFDPPLPDATETLRQLRAGETDAERVVSAYLARLEACQPHLNAATHILRPEALAEARQPRSGPLAGLPISVKETIGLAGHVITAGSQRMPPRLCATDAAIVQRLRAAGAIVIARSNVPELAMTGETSNHRFGRTNNRLDQSRGAGGSSGGEGALVGAGASAAGLGSDILGSIRLPAAFNAIVGFKPAAEAVNKSGAYPVIESYLDSWLGIGPLTRSVRDARLIYDVIADVPTPAPAPIKGLRLIIPTDFPLSYRSASIPTALVHARTVLEAAGMAVEEQHSFADVGELFLNLLALIAHDREQALLSDLVTAGGAPLRRPAEIVRQLAGRPTIDSGLLQMLVTMPLVKPRASRAPALIERFEAARRHYRALLGSDGVLLLPTLGVLALPHGAFNRASLRPGVNGLVTPLTFPNYLNLPALAQPAWSDVERATGLPPSIMLVSAPGAEGALLDVAAALEAKIGRAPTAGPSDPG